jgi:hypothetical protein
MPDNPNQKQVKTIWTDADWHFWYEERAAIHEFVGNLPRAEAEARARIECEQERTRSQSNSDVLLL